MNPIPLVTIARDDVVYFAMLVDGVGWVFHKGDVRVKMMTTPWLQAQDGLQNSLLGGGRLTGTLEKTSGWPGCMEKRHDILRKASPRLKETEEYFTPGSLPVQPQVIMGSGLVNLSCDLGWDGASRCRTTVGLDEHRTVVRGTLRKTMFRSSCSQTPWSARI